MTDIDKKITANRIVRSCKFITKNWEYELMFNALVAALHWAERTSVKQDSYSETDEGE